ncbi:MAG: Crp/Fnr family transcriptional regulator [Ferruginibacter sp.]
MDHPLIHTIRKDVDLSDEEAAYMLSFYREKSYRKNELILQPGVVAHDVFFVLNGGLHQYYITENGADRSCAFCFENNYITDLESFSKKIPASSYLRTLMPSKCLLISCEDLTELLNTSPAVSKYFGILMERIAAESIRRTKSLLSSTPEKQFKELLEQEPEIFQKVPQRYIAQYLGVAPESLSRIKKRLMQAVKS